MTSITDVALLAGVSATTAKRAIKEPEKLHPDTLRRVQDAIAELHYEPDLRAGALRAGQSRTVGVMLGSIIEPFFAQLARTLSVELRRNGYNMLLTENEYQSEQELAELKLLYGQRIDALILRPGYGNKSRDYLARLHERGVFIAQIDYCSPGTPYPSVMLDNPGAVREGVRYLHSLGHRRIAATGKFDQKMHPEMRSYTFPAAMAEVGLSAYPEYEQVMFLTEDNAYQYTLKVMRLPQPPTALFALTGASAAGCYRALQELNISVPDDVSLLTFDNYSWMGLVSPGITALEQPAADMARAAVQMTLAALSGEEYTREVVFPAQLIVRGSCAAPRPDSVAMQLSGSVRPEALTKG
ncbi:LacI family transcriptional regulator (plasmid) [Deinococcus sp. KNUC1210]|uniref:LacI family DNA-binding transcriptional regulator n=1 Tax=Deinococcus sp. KNUC1210 TaxID=2917691 RepID=UPI001EEF959A|nr:LacI family DNA-binding transcriptional regulator [Deinococcus sp. KNUC1210]ULH13823.1 LacI family transcriptional regulator [Deinococcus sp. KNUC1210]ULH14192.1 LacI family transcriptional regulator [Deinococcus sp. KNUC1210]